MTAGQSRSRPGSGRPSRSWSRGRPAGLHAARPGQLREELAVRGLKVSGGKVFARLHTGREALDEVIDAFSREAKVLSDVAHVPGPPDRAVHRPAHRAASEPGQPPRGLYCDGEHIEIIPQAPERITDVHLKFVDPAVRARVQAEGGPWPRRSRGAS